MSLEQMSLKRQMEMIFQTLSEELRHLSSGTVFVQIRADVIGKFGIRHYPMELKGATVIRQEAYMTDNHLQAFTDLAVASLDYKNGWTHGEIFFEFAMRKDILCASVQFESHYNMANVMAKFNSFRQDNGKGSKG